MLNASGQASPLVERAHEQRVGREVRMHPANRGPPLEAVRTFEASEMEDTERVFTEGLEDVVTPEHPRHDCFVGTHNASRSEFDGEVE